MSNMSYCRMENTYNDLMDVYNNWDNPENETEKSFRDKIRDLCIQISEETENSDEDGEDFDDDENWGNQGNWDPFFDGNEDGDDPIIGA